ncbi:MAG: signal peptidase I [Holosporaceae bacterium]|jgi:signal peptidase I|nr:signal peptidase I [Holosporaceae bacterium]
MPREKKNSDDGSEPSDVSEPSGRSWLSKAKKFCKSEFFRENVSVPAGIVVVFLLFRFFVYDYYIVPSSSMVPTLLIGDMPLVEKWAYGYSRHSIWFSPNLFSGRIMFRKNLKRGEIIVFKAPEDEDINVIKRLIALPGDKISVLGGVISVNGAVAQLTFKGKMVYKDTNQRAFHELMLYEEKLPLSDAPLHTVAYNEFATESKANRFEEITVPEGYYFVMGDNRDFSKDSRCGLGMVPAENIMGRAICTIHSIDNGVKLWEPWLWIQNIRYDRIFKKLN